LGGTSDRSDGAHGLLVLQASTFIQGADFVSAHAMFEYIKDGEGRHEDDQMYRVGIHLWIKKFLMGDEESNWHLGIGLSQLYQDQNGVLQRETRFDVQFRYNW